MQRLQAAQGQGQNTSAAEDATPSSERSSYATTPQPMPPPSTSAPRSPSLMHARGSFDLAREALHRRSRTPSRGATSPGLRRPSFGLDNGDSAGLAGRDESAFYQAETQNLTRENQMLKQRIRELGTSPLPYSACVDKSWSTVSLLCSVSLQGRSHKGRLNSEVCPSNVAGLV